MEQPKEPLHKALCGEFWSDLGIKYEEAYGDDPALVRAVHRWLSFLPKGSSVVECGCGTGKPIARTIADAGYQYTGTDLASGMVEICKKQVPEGSYEVVDMLKYEPKNPFDGVVASLSHFELSPEETRAMGRKWFQWLRPGGYLLLSTITGEEYVSDAPKSWDPEQGCASGVEQTFMGNKIVITLYTQDGWKKLFKEAGFEVAHTETDMFVPKAESPEEPRYYLIAKKPSNA